MEELVSIYIDIVKEKNRLPTYSDFFERGITRDKIRSKYVNLTNLHALVEEEYNEQLSQYIAHESNVFSKLKLEELSEDIKKFKRFFITTAVVGKPVDQKFFKSIKLYCEKNNAKLLILPCADVASRQKQIKWIFDKALDTESFIFTETKLNNNLFLSSIKISAKQILPTTGLSRIGQRNGSYIFASPKQNLEYVINSTDKDSVPRAIMTTGAVTVADYDHDRYMSERISYIAESDHVMGGIIVEIENNRFYHFRQVQSDANGRFIDLGKMYDGESISDVESYLILGDWHSGSVSNTVTTVLGDIVKTVNAKHLVVHDLFDGKSINPHELHKPLNRARLALDGKISLKDELEKVGYDLAYLQAMIPEDGQVIIVKSNHDEFLDRYLINGEYIKDPINHRICLELAIKYLDGEKVLKWACETYGDKFDKKRVVWLDRDESYKVANIELGQHGDKGLNGAKGSLLGAEKSYGPSVIGHAHSPAILRGVYRVGTFTDLRLDYVSGPSTWLNTCCVLYPDTGMRQLINIQKTGKWRLT